MCRSHGQGHRRCKGSAATKASESLRKAINYQATKAGVSVQEWKEQNPDHLELIQSIYDSKIEKFEQEEAAKSSISNSGGEILLTGMQTYEAANHGVTVTVEEWKEKNPNLVEVIKGTYQKMFNKFSSKLSKVKPTEPTGHVEEATQIDGDGEALDTGTQTPSEDAKKHLIKDYGFEERGEPRERSREELHVYTRNCRDNANELNLTKREEMAISHYTYDLYKPLNQFLLFGEKYKDEVSEDLFDEFASPWNEEDSKYNDQFKNEDDLIDYVNQLDSALSHRVEEPRILYRGRKVRYDSRDIVEMNNGDNVDDTAHRKGFMESMYAPGAELAFDAYSSASESAGVAAEWCNASSSWEMDTGVIFEIKTSAGVPIAHLSGHSQEREILMPRGLNFKVVNSYWNSDDEKCYKYENIAYDAEAKNKGTLIVQLVEIDANGNEIDDHSTKYEAPSLMKIKQ